MRFLAFLPLAACASTAPGDLPDLPDAAEAAPPLTRDAPPAVDVGVRDAANACTWPASLDRPDGSVGDGRCFADRAYVQCGVHNGAGTWCLSGDPTRCDGTDIACVSQCAPDEYAVGCGLYGPGPVSAPPPHCREQPPSAGGIRFACCPCGS